MAKLSYKYSYTWGNATASCTITATFGVSNSDTTTTVTASNLEVSTVSVSGGTSTDQINAMSFHRQNLAKMTVPLVFNGQTVATRTGVEIGVSYPSYTGSKSVTKAYSAQTKTLTLIGATTNISVPAKTSYSITYNANSGTGAPATQTKWYGENINLSTTKPSKAGYKFNGWATSVANANAGTVTYNTNNGTIAYTTNAALNLYAVWELAYTKPQITGLTVERCTQDGEIDDDGKYAKVTFNWAVYTSSGSRYYRGSGSPYSNNLPNCTITVGTFSETPTLSTTPYTTILGDGTFNSDTEYTASVVISDTQTVYTGSAKTTIVNARLATAIYPMDINADGTAMGLFRTAPDDGDGIYLGKPVVLEKAEQDKDTFYYARRSDTNVQVGFGVGGSGIRHGVWSHKLGKWLIYGDETNVYIDGNKQMPAVRTLVNGRAYQGTKSNAWEYVSGATFTVPSNHMYLVVCIQGYASGRPIGLGLGTTTDQNPPIYIATSSGSSETLYRATFLLTANSTYYLFTKRATVPASTNNYSVYAIDFKYQ